MYTRKIGARSCFPLLPTHANETEVLGTVKVIVRLQAWALNLPSVCLLFTSCREHTLKARKRRTMGPIFNRTLPSPPLSPWTPVTTSGGLTGDGSTKQSMILTATLCFPPGTSSFYKFGLLMEADLIKWLNETIQLECWQDIFAYPIEQQRSDSIDWEADNVITCAAKCLGASCSLVERGRDGLQVHLLTIGCDANVNVHCELPTTVEDTVRTGIKSYDFYTSLIIVHLYASVMENHGTVRSTRGHEFTSVVLKDHFNMSTGSAELVPRALYVMLSRRSPGWKGTSASRSKKWPILSMDEQSLKG
ncbi:hypothetical protein EGR_08161 [Echinococcus granulosus]|uniref:Uncharacterized protein n=1 Tax=Echinococcus granulosus TaxID=6210 RepID=W6U755_ECHGR|nr:hypothetical protein EGR_08161 [Echinococcus granulosus]EUB57010.1 hypothetical protein EGR_08161 [Echinococcus granulosus]